MYGAVHYDFARFRSRSHLNLKKVFCPLETPKPLHKLFFAIQWFFLLVFAFWDLVKFRVVFCSEKKPKGLVLFPQKMCLSKLKKA